jgi:hypothetical protein
MAEESSRSRIKIETSRDIALPQEGSEICLAIRSADWTRIKRNLSKVIEPPNYLLTISAILFGVSATAGLTIIPLILAAEVPPWVVPTYAATTLFSALVAVILWCLDRSVRKWRKSEVANVQSDMDEIEKFFEQENGSTESIMDVVRRRYRERLKAAIEAERRAAAGKESTDTRIHGDQDTQ